MSEETELQKINDSLEVISSVLIPSLEKLSFPSRMLETKSNPHQMPTIYDLLGEIIDQQKKTNALLNDINNFGIKTRKTYP